MSETTYLVNRQSLGARVHHFGHLMGWPMLYVELCQPRHARKVLPSECMAPCYLVLQLREAQKLLPVLPWIWVHDRENYEQGKDDPLYLEPLLEELRRSFPDKRIALQTSGRKELVRLIEQLQRTGGGLDWLCISPSRYLECPWLHRAAEEVVMRVDRDGLDEPLYADASPQHARINAMGFRHRWLMPADKTQRSWEQCRTLLLVMPGWRICPFVDEEAWRL